MKQNLADEYENFFLSKFEGHLTDQEISQLKDLYQTTDEAGKKVDFSNQKIAFNDPETVNTLKKQFYSQFGGEEGAQALGLRIMDILTSNLEKDIRIDKKFPRLSKDHPFKTWSNMVGGLVKYSESYLSTFVQEWYHTFFVPKFKKHSRKIWTKTFLILIVGFFVYKLLEKFL